VEEEVPRLQGAEMNRDDIIRMAKEAGMLLGRFDVWDAEVSDLERFAKAIEQHLSYDSIHTCHDKCQRPACVAVREAVKAEREACAQLVENYALQYDEPVWALKLTAAIQSRGEK
jgi:hypothetical protein